MLSGSEQSNSQELWGWKDEGNIPSDSFMSLRCCVEMRDMWQDAWKPRDLEKGPLAATLLNIHTLNTSPVPSFICHPQTHLPLVSVLSCTSRSYSCCLLYRLVLCCPGCHPPSSIREGSWDACPEGSSLSSLQSVLVQKESWQPFHRSAELWSTALHIYIVCMG